MSDEKNDSPDVLVTDDNPANLDLLCGMLRERGYRVRVATNGTRALAAARAALPDLIMLDVNMPGMNGYDVCRELKKDETTNASPVIFISALDEVVDKVKAFEAGGADYVTKPFEFGEVLARIENQLKISRLQRQLEQRNAELLRMNEELRMSQKRESRMFTALSDVLPGAVLDGKYRVEEKIGSGGFGTVFRATQLNLDRQVAVKIFQSMAAAAKPEDLARFQAEGVSACRVAHPNALGIIDSGVSSTGIAYLVMELLSGHTLAEELREKSRLPVQRVAEIVVPICAVLATAHASGVIHRDIKPDNIFLHQTRDAEVVKVLDFGIAKLVHDTTSTYELKPQESSQVIGTPLYISPERLMNRQHDGRADIYSLGVMIYQMLTGTTPYGDARSLAALAMMHMNAAPTPLQSHDETIANDVQQVVLATLEKNPLVRPSLTDIESCFLRLRA